MSDDGSMDWVERVRGTYHVPPETPREAMWEAIAARLDERPAEAEAEVIDLSVARVRRFAAANTRRGMILPTAAAAALVILGVGIGRISAPMVTTPETSVASAVVPSGRDALGFAASEHLGRTESLLTLVRADARNGDLDPATARWARDLLSGTRLFLDTRPASDREVRALLEDLELVLVQIVGASEAGQHDTRGRAELQIALRGLEEGEVLPRIRAAVQAGA